MLFQEKTKNLKEISLSGAKMQAIAALSLSHSLFPLSVKSLFKNAD